MPRFPIPLVFAASLCATTVFAQNPIRTPPTPMAHSVTASDKSTLAGKWTYRSYHNSADQVGSDATKALSLIFGEGVFTLETPRATMITGTFDMGGGFVLDLQGIVKPATEEAPFTVHMFGNGRAGTPTEGWQYDYHGSLAYTWPNGIDQVPSLVGSVIRAKPHGAARAGYVASFIAVRQP